MAFPSVQRGHGRAGGHDLDGLARCHGDMVSGSGGNGERILGWWPSAATGHGGGMIDRP